MTVHEEAIAKIQQLPESMVEQINDFIDFLILRKSSSNSADYLELSQMQETLYLQSIPGMVESIHKAAATSLDDCIELKDLDW